MVLSDKDQLTIKKKKLAFACRVCEIIPGLWRPEDCFNFGTTMDYIASPRLVRAIQGDSISKVEGEKANKRY